MCSVSELPGIRLRGLGSARGPFRRCLCWCCCCSCNGSCLAVRNGEDNGPTKKEPGPSDVLLCDGEPPPSLEEIQSWGTSFDKLMRSTAGRKVFRDFLRCEYSEENILFWLACEELKKESNPDAVEEKARFIYEDYISILSPKEVSLDSRVREVVNRNMVEPTPHTFDEAQLQIYTLMHRDSYPRFVNSSLYKTLAQVATTSCAARSGSRDEGEEMTSSSSCKQPLCSVNKEEISSNEAIQASSMKETISTQHKTDDTGATQHKDINKSECEIIKSSMSESNQTMDKNIDNKTVPTTDTKASVSSENKENVIETKESAPNKKSGGLPHNSNKQ